LSAGFARACVLSLASPAAFALPPASHAVRVDANLEARMRDGVALRADVYRPDSPGRFPALLLRTPYSKNPAGGPEAYRELASRGYLVVVQDTRGRYMSDGVARPHDEGEDGYDTIEWLAGLPHVDGRIGMFGGSYSATAQLTAAPLRPPGLVALLASGSYASRYDMVYPGGAFYLADGLAWNLGQAMDVRRRVGSPAVARDSPIGLSPEQQATLRSDWLWQTPLKSMNALGLRRFAPGYFELLDHPSFDSFWETFEIQDRHPEFEVPALHLTGWYDTLLGGTLRNFAGLRAHARTRGARDNQRLIVGPWTHAHPDLHSTRIGEVDFGTAAGLDWRDLMTDWFGHWLRGEASSTAGGPPVRIFVMGVNAWRSEQEWPLARARAVPYYLHSQGRANGSSGDGQLSPTPPRSQPVDRYVYDPANPVPSAGLGSYSRAPTDRRALEQRQDVLVFSSAPLSAPLEVTGPVSLVLWVASSAPDTDFTGQLVDVLPDGTARALSDGILRARYRRGRSQPERLTPGEPTELSIDLGATSNVFLPGHRIRLEVSSSNFPRFDRNPNTGGRFGEDTALRPAKQTLFHDSRRPSRLVLPIVPR
jgi:putative CocE/NonD family hydrolase